MVGLSASTAIGQAAVKPVCLWLEAEDFQYHGDWVAVREQRWPPSGKEALFAGPKGAALPAVTAIDIPAKATYAVWVKSLDLASFQPGLRRFTIEVAGQRAKVEFGTHGGEGWGWQRAGEFAVEKGLTALVLVDTAKSYGRCDALLLTTDSAYTPVSPTKPAMAQRVTPLTVAAQTRPEDELAAPTLRLRDLAASVANESLKLDFYAAEGQRGKEIVKKVSVKDNGAWRDAGIAPEAEGFFVLQAAESTLDLWGGFFPRWAGGGNRGMVRIGAVEVETLVAGREDAWFAGRPTRMPMMELVSADGRSVRLKGQRQGVGTLEVIWTLEPHVRPAQVRFVFTPEADGFFSVAYRGFLAASREEVDFLLLPFMWHGKRLPERTHLLLECFTPTPIALVQRKSCSFALVADPSEIPFHWPSVDGSRFGFAIRSADGRVQPALFAPVLGMKDSQMQRGKPYAFALRYVVEPGAWFAAYERVVRDIFKLRDYRRNVGHSLTEAVFNLTDLMMDDKHGGWWPRAKGPYNIESKNTVTHASPLTALQMYLLTGDREIYRRRALPTMEYLASRQSAHFCPITNDVGSYASIKLGGPCTLYGAGLYAGFYEATRRLSPVFRQFAFAPDGQPRHSRGYSHIEPFDEHLAAYRLTGDKQFLEAAKSDCDAYLRERLPRFRETVISERNFINIHYMPDWEGLLEMWEATGERRYLDAAAEGGRWLATTLWTQPVIPADRVKVHEGNQYGGSSPKWVAWYQGENYRLGFPRQEGDVRERDVDAWRVSQVGLGLEQPITYKRRDSHCANIFMSSWAPTLMRVGHAAGEGIFSDFARNAVLGRFANYPGYYNVGFSDQYLAADYPTKGPDVTMIYHHHILPHLAFTVDFLVSEAEVRSKGQIKFPYVLQRGYAWFSNRIFGFAPGTVYGAKDVWLWLRRGLVTLDTPKVNYLTAHSRDTFYVVLLNEECEEVPVRIKFGSDVASAEQLQKATAMVRQADGKAGPLRLDGLAAATTVAPLGITVVAIGGLDIRIPLHSFGPWAKRPPGNEREQDDGTFVTLKTAQPALGEVHAMVFMVEPTSYDAYVYLTATDKETQRAVLHWRTGGEWRTVEKADYPFEFSVPVSDPKAPFEFYVEAVDQAGGTVRTDRAGLRPTQ
ncbi:MAG: hypothetical protein FJ279_15735 [Planctomycetes bacterium]|nr:hypothetical protein [Planctomycetota bacterium]